MLHAHYTVLQGIASAAVFRKQIWINEESDAMTSKCLVSVWVCGGVSHSL